MDDPYPEIGRILAAAASATGTWRTVVLDASVGEDWARFRAVAVSADGHERGISLPDLERLHVLFKMLRAKTREVAPDQPEWTSARFTLQHDGHFGVDFAYE